MMLQAVFSAVLVQRKVEDEDEDEDEQRNRVQLTDRGRRHRQEEFEDEDEDEDNQQNKMKMSSDKDGDWNFDSARMLFCNTDSKAIQPSIFNRIREKEVKSGADQPKIIRAGKSTSQVTTYSETLKAKTSASDIIIKFRTQERKQGTDMDIFWCIVDALAQECNHGKFSDVRRRHEDQFFALIGDTVSAANGQSISSNYCGRAGGVVNLSQTAPQTTGLISSSEPIAADNSSLLTPDTTPEQTWRVASAAPQHMTGYLNHLIDYTPASGDQVIDTPNMGPLAVHGRGSVNTANITLQDVLYVPCLDANLVSTGQLAQLGYMITLGPYGCRIYKDDEDMPLVGEAHYVDGYLLELDFLRVRPSTN